MPLYHSAASCMSVLTVLFAGATQALGRKFSTRSFWDEVEATRSTMIQYVGETLRYLLAAPPRRDPATGEDLDRRHRVRLAFGNGLRPDVWDRFKERFGIDTLAELYTATEGTFATFNLSANDYARGAIGRHGWFYSNIMRRDVALVEVDWDTEAPLRDPATGFCRKVAPGEPGEMLFCLPADDIHSRFQGYYNNPEATAKKVLRDVFRKGDAYFRTGDVVRWTADGLIYFSDRIGDTFRWKSENVSTAEVSEAVGNHPAVREANVYGVELPHHDGRAGCAAVSLDAASAGPDALPDTLRSLAAHVRAALPRFAVPIFLRVLDGDPGNSNQTTGTNKQQKQALRVAGVQPDPARDAELGRLFWLSADGYEPFQEKDWNELSGGRVKL
jgi:acyl-CoA synthetase (AMP-forming)/AMP-acid ligase II